MPNVRHKREALTSAGVSFYLGASAAAPQPIPFRRSIKALLTIKPSKIRDVNFIMTGALRLQGALAR